MLKLIEWKQGVTWIDSEAEIYICYSNFSSTSPKTDRIAAL